MTASLCILTSESFATETAALTAANSIPGCVFAAYPHRCGRPPVTWDEIRSAVGNASIYDGIHVLGGCCLAALNEPPADFPPCSIIHLENCFDLVASRFAIKRLIADGAYLFTPGWVASWPRQIEQWGFSQETAREFFADTTRQITLLDTGSSISAPEDAAQFAAFVDRPLQILPVGLDLLSLRVKDIKACLEIQRACNDADRSRQHYADYAMAFDLLSTIVRTVDETEVVGQTLNLYQMLFAAGNVAFIRQTQGDSIEVISGGFSEVSISDDIRSRIDTLDAEFCMLEKGDGFLLRVTYTEELLGIVLVSELALPQHRDQYLNLALATIGICGLAIANARMFQRVLDVSSQLSVKNQEIEQAYLDLKNAHSQLLQQEKMASIGQLAAGVAHEINNPMGFITSNLGTLNKYVQRMTEYLAVAERCVVTSSAAKEANSERKRLKIDRISEDINQLITESLDGATRVRQIVQDLKSFSRVDQPTQCRIDINQCVESAINISRNETKYVAEIVRELGEVPQIDCFPQQLNQVFLNLLVNSAHAIERNGIITVRSWHDGSSVFVSVADTGCGIPPEICSRIFDPFFTTKDVGKGTGLGLSISYDIVAKHGGTLTVVSQVGAGTTFTVSLPLSLEDGTPR